jgi:hypothetical protein
VLIRPGLLMSRNSASGSVERSIVLDPPDPGEVFEPAPGAGAPWTTMVTTTGISTIKWVVVTSGFSWRGSGTDVPTDGSIEITPTFVETGDFLLVMDADDIAFQIFTQAATVSVQP